MTVCKARRVKICLVKKGKVTKKKRTKVSTDRQPHFNESFTFKLASKDVDKSSVDVLVYQHSTLHRDEQLLGRIALGSYMFARGREVDHWNQMVARPREQILAWHMLN